MYTSQDINTIIRRSTKFRCVSRVETNIIDKTHHITLELDGTGFDAPVKVEKTITSKQMKLMNYQFYRQILEPMVDTVKVC